MIPAKGEKIERYLGSISEFTVPLVGLNAIYDALVWTEKNKTEVVIFTDSQASARALSNPNQSQNLQYILKRIIRHADRLRNGGIKVQAVWIPAHMRIEGNKSAGKAAKEATGWRGIRHQLEKLKERVTQYTSETPKLPQPVESVKRKIRKNILEKWTQQWDSNINGRD